MKDKYNMKKYKIGGGGGNRTRVRKCNHRNLYEHSPDLILAIRAPSGQSPGLPALFNFPVTWKGCHLTGSPVLWHPEPFPPDREKWDALLI